MPTARKKRPSNNPSKGAIFRIGEQRAGDKSSQRRRQAGFLHDQGDAYDGEQRACRHRFAHARCRNQTVEPAEQKPPGQDHAHNGADRKDGSTQVHGRTLGASGGEQRHERDERDGGEVLKQQHGEGEPAVARVDLALLLQHLQRESRRRER
jgi:hypothetical protein